MDLRRRSLRNEGMLTSRGGVGQRPSAARRRGQRGERSENDDAVMGVR